MEQSPAPPQAERRPRAGWARVGPDGGLEVEVEQRGSDALRGAVVHPAALQACGEHLTDLVGGGVAPARRAAVLGPQPLDEVGDLPPAQQGVERLELARHDAGHEVPYDAVVAHHGVEVRLGELVGRPMGDELDQAPAQLRVVGERRQPPRACPGDRFELALGRVLEGVGGHDGVDEPGGVRDALIEHEPGDGAGLVDEPLLAGDGPPIRLRGAHRASPMRRGIAGPSMGASKG